MSAVLKPTLRATTRQCQRVNTRLLRKRTKRNRKIWEYFVLENTTGLGRLKSWINAAGGDATQILTRDQVNACMGKPFLAKVVVEPGSNGYGPKNKISSFKSGSAPAAAQPQAPQQPQTTPQPTGQVTAQQVQQLFPFDTTAAAIAQRRQNRG